ncbi:MAG TPA: iron-containing alcohol dehydrogenase [Gammaproteobacteria bacterium]|nr:iron-containing alcohol dehydrogenase [Gammaproteobacteria bacterium]
MNTAPRANWSYPTAVRFGAGRIAELPEACRELGLVRPLLVTDPGLAKLPMIASALATNQAAGIPTALFADLRPNPVSKNVDDGLVLYRRGHHDGVIAFGGGSALDTGKTIAFMAGQTRPMWDFEDIGDYWKRADPKGIAPIIAVPTTAGTGSEVGRAAVILNEADHTKRILFHPKMMPSIVISDPELTVGLPAHVTAATGMDALAHCLEAYCVSSFHPLAEGIAVEGMRLIKEWLPVAVRDGKNLTARAHMMAAASMGAAAFQKGLGAIHALSHPVGALYDTHHGLTNGVVMPYVLAFNRQAIETKLTRLAAWLDLQPPSFDAVMDWVLRLREEIGIPHTLRDLGVGTDRLDELAAMAAVDPTADTNPIPIGVKELRSMFVAAIEGRLP